MPAARTQDGTDSYPTTISDAVGETNANWQSTWDITSASIKSWAANNQTNSDAYAWWKAATALSRVLNTWYVAWYNDTTGGDVQVKGSDATTDVAANKPCDLSGAGQDWTATADGDGSEGDCKTQCTSKNEAALLHNAGSSSGTDVPIYTANSSDWCGAYSYDERAPDAGNTDGHADAGKCQLLLATNPEGNGSDIAAVAEATHENAASHCGKAEYVNAWLTKQGAVKSAYDTIIADANKLDTDMQNTVNAQAALEQSWLEAWYLQQYWTVVEHLLKTDSAGTLAKEYADRKTALDDGATDNDTTTAGAEKAKDDEAAALATAEEALAKLQATTAEAAATVAALGARILRADAQIESLVLLTREAKTDGLNPEDDGYDAAAEDAKNYAGGALRTAAALRTTEWEDYTREVAADGKPQGESVLAAANKAEKDALVKAREGETEGTGGQLVEDAAAALKDWTDAQGEFDDAKGNLTAKLGDAKLEDLRKEVEDAKTTWDGLAS